MEASKDFPSDKMVQEFEYLAVLDAGYALTELGRQLDEGKRNMNKEFEVESQEKPTEPFCPGVLMPWFLAVLLSRL